MAQNPWRQYSVGYERGWLPRVCPNCGSEAAWHGFLYAEPAPSWPLTSEAKRTAVGEVFGHMGGDDCVCLSESRPNGI